MRNDVAMSAAILWAQCHSLGSRSNSITSIKSAVCGCPQLDSLSSEFRESAVTSWQHRLTMKINDCSVNSGQSAYCATAAESFLGKSGCPISRTCGKKDRKRAVFPRITICEGLVPDVESSFLKFTDVQVTNHNAKRSRITWPIRSDKA